MNLKLAELHALCLKLTNADEQQRLQQIAEYFFDVEYGAWQDGSSFESLDDFNYQLDLLDCVTYPEVVLALTKIEPNPDYDQFANDFENILRKIHYANGVPNFISRNHFTCIDWIPNNKYMLEDITPSLSPAFKMAKTIIDRPAWFAQHTINQPRENPLADNIAKQIPAQESNIAYIETKEILDNYDNYVTAFPQYSIANIVRPNWDLTQAIGTHLNISHLGFVFKNPAATELFFYHSTITKMKVVKESLREYLQRCLDSPTIRGINVLAISPGYALKPPSI